MNAGPLWICVPPLPKATPAATDGFKKMEPNTLWESRSHVFLGESTRDYIFCSHQKKNRFRKQSDAKRCFKQQRLLEAIDPSPSEAQDLLAVRERKDLLEALGADHDHRPVATSRNRTSGHRSLRPCETSKGKRTTPQQSLK